MGTIIGLLVVVAIVLLVTKSGDPPTRNGGWA
jgi:hypothetical protein